MTPRFCAVELEQGVDDAHAREVLRDVLEKAGVTKVYFSDECGGFPLEVAELWTPVPDGRIRLVAWGDE